MPKQTDLQAAMNHRYRVVHDGPTVPGVTTIVDVATDKGGMVYAAAEIAARELVLYPRRRKQRILEERKRLMEKKGPSDWAVQKRALGEHGSDEDVLIHWARGEHRRQWDLKSARGTRVHAIAEAWSRGETPTVLLEDEGYVDALEAFHKAAEPRFVHLECIVLSTLPHPYGGRFDAIVEMFDDRDMGRGIYLADYKTSDRTYPWNNALQAAGYMGGLLASYDDAGALDSCTAFPRLDGARTIALHEDGTCTVSDPFENISPGGAFLSFCSALDIYYARKPFDNWED